MSKQRIDLNRFKKVYPAQRRSPHYFNKTHNAYGATISLAATDSGSVTVEHTGVISTTPVATITSSDNVNVWISAIARSVPSDATSDWKVTVNASSPFTGSVHILLVEAT